MISLTVAVMTEWGEFVLTRDAPIASKGQPRWTFPLGQADTSARVQQGTADTIQAYLRIRPDEKSVTHLDSPPTPWLERPVGNSHYPLALCCYVLSCAEYHRILANNWRALGRDNQIWIIDKDQLERHARMQPHLFNERTLAIFMEPWYRASLFELWTSQLTSYRTRVLGRILGAEGERVQDRLHDTLVIDAIAPKPTEPATGFEVEGVFLDGKATLHGAYRIGDMMQVAMLLEPWETKFAQPFDKYVKKELEILKRELSSRELGRRPSRIDAEEAVEFVRDILHFPLEDGTCLRKRLTNLEEITACRHAFRLFLESRTNLPLSIIGNPIGLFNDQCNHIVASLWREIWCWTDGDLRAELKRIVKLSILLNALDFHSPEFDSAWGDSTRLRAIVELQFQRVHRIDFSPALGGDTFFQKFLGQIAPREEESELTAVYLTDNNGQLVASLKLIETVLSLNKRLKVVLVPKNGSHWNDASWADVDKLLHADASHDRPIFNRLRTFSEQKRFRICHQGPQTHGLHPAYLSKELCYFLRRSDLVLAEGQAYAEIRGWLKPTFLMFQVTGRVAEAIHGVDRSKRALAFVGVGFGANHYGQPERLLRRSMKDAAGAGEIHVFGQTTVDHVEALLSRNYAVLKARLFGGDEAILHRSLQEEVNRTGRNMAEIVLGRRFGYGRVAAPSRKLQDVDVFAIGGGGGFNQVTLKALSALDVRVVAAVPSTDDGGSTGRLQAQLDDRWGYIFGMGDAASILEQQVGDWAKKPILSFRPNVDAESFVDALVGHIVDEIVRPTFSFQKLTDCDDWLTFICEQLNLAWTIDEVFLQGGPSSSFSIKGASVRNLNIVSAFYQSEALKEKQRKHCGELFSHAGVAKRAEFAWYMLEKALGLDISTGRSAAVVPVTYERAQIWARYRDPIPQAEVRRLGIPHSDLSEDRTLVYRQRNIDQIIHDSVIIDFGIYDRMESRYPKPNPYYLAALNAARLVVMGAGSLYSSQLAQLAIPEVMEAIIRKGDARKVLVVNHVRMNETIGYSLADHIRAIEILANKVVRPELKAEFGRDVRIGDIFTDIVIPRTVAREINIAISEEARRSTRSKRRRFESMRQESGDDPVYVDEKGVRVDRETGIYLNGYVAYVLDHPEFRRKHRITSWELTILGFLEQEPSLYSARSEAGRYRGAIYALRSDLDYIVRQGIPRRSIYEVESIAMNTKLLKAEGKPRLETFPGLIPESLVGVFKILLAKGAS